MNLDLLPNLFRRSPVVAAGDNTVVPPGVVTDLSGKARIEDDARVPDTGNGMSLVADIGAYEVRAPRPKLRKKTRP